METNKLIPHNIMDCYLDLKKLSERSSLCVRNLRARLKGENPIPHHRVGQKVLVRWSDFTAWMEHHREGVASGPIDSKIQKNVDKILTGLR